MPAGRVKLTAGTDVVRCLQFSSRVFRWYADCCRTPIANTAGPRFPVVGLIHSFMNHDAEGRARDEMLGAPLCRIFEQSAVGPLPPNAPAPRSLAQLSQLGEKSEQHQRRHSGSFHYTALVGRRAIFSGAVIRGGFCGGRSSLSWRARSFWSAVSSV
jgi:Family of unknown function (DUF6151)